MLLAAVLRRIGKPQVSYVYLHSVRSLARQMKSSGVIPDTFALNLIIKAYCWALPKGVVGEGNELLQGDEIESTSAHDDYKHGGDLQPIARAAAKGGGRGDLAGGDVQGGAVGSGIRSAGGAPTEEGHHERKDALRLVGQPARGLPAVALIASSCLK
ncbi:hypothetical protein ZIOFF_069377 [Zingiber officinale]|uniref:Uncharacterized protein n=1 Tax=Zingiber officinale TaxID=94328 RepID=A0A8J5CDK7_ZINOF|nr:hypothetical protein ZIOFF_069377 [Zingiber officinale]